MTLTEAAFWTKRFGVIALAGFIIFLITVLILTIKPEDVAMPEYLSANFACTESREEFLTHRLEIPSLTLAKDSEAVFEIATDTGKIDSLPSIVNVFKFANPTQSLTAQADAKKLARKMGFNPEDIGRESTESYLWIDMKTGRKLEIYSKNLNFKLETNSQIASKLSQEGPLPSEEKAKDIALNTLRTLGVAMEGYTTGNHRATPVNINPDGSFRKAASLAEADLIRVDLQRNISMITIPSNVVGGESMIQKFSKKMKLLPTEDSMIINDEKIEVYTFNTVISFPQSQKSNITVYVGPEISEMPNGINQVYYINYTYWPIYPEICGTYELLDPRIAIEKVQSGEGSLVYLHEIGGDDIVEYMPRSVKTFVVMDVLIVYYEDREELDYLQPVYLVTGEAIFTDGTKGSFDFFYPAINYEIVQDRIYLPEPEIEEEKGFF